MANEVDLILAAWARELPEVDVTPLGSLSRYYDAASSALGATEDPLAPEMSKAAVLRRRVTSSSAAPSM